LKQVLYLLAEGKEESAVVVRVLSDVTKQPESHALAETVLATGDLCSKLMRQFVMFLTSDSPDIVHNTLKALYNISQYGSLTREAVAKETVILKALMNTLYLARQGGDFEENACDAAIILGCLASERKNRDLFLPYEQYLVQIVSSESGLSDFAVDILAQLVSNKEQQ